MKVIDKTGVNVKDISQNMSLCEAGQPVYMKFAMANAAIKSGKVSRITPWMRCRDFFTEMCLVEYSNYEVSCVYGFEWDRSRKITKNRMQLLVLVKDSSFLEEIPTIHKMESLFTKERTRVYMLKNTTKEQVYLLTAPKEWQRSGVTLSIYTWLLRRGLTKNITNASNAFDMKVPSYINTYLPGTTEEEFIGNVMRNVNTIFTNPVYNKSLESNNLKIHGEDIHGNCGIVSFLSQIKYSRQNLHYDKYTWARAYNSLNEEK